MLTYIKNEKTQNRDAEKVCEQNFPHDKQMPKRNEIERSKSETDSDLTEKMKENNIEKRICKIDTPSASYKEFKTAKVFLENPQQVPVKFKAPLTLSQSNENTKSRLSSWSSQALENSLSDLYCDDEFKLSLEFEPNMLLYTTIEEEGGLNNNSIFPDFQNIHEGT